MTRGKRVLSSGSSDISLTKEKNEEPKIKRALTPPSDPSVAPPVNVDTVIYGSYEMKAWYYSPYPLDFGTFIDRLYICDNCLRYMQREAQLINHKAECKARKPPGRSIYSNGTIKVYEIDGHEHKLFLDVKTLYFDTDGFKFYVLTERHPKYKSIEYMVGYFSKEKLSYDGYNLACIMTLPSHQRKGYGRLLIELSYEISKHEGKIGSPEKPLSPLGSLGYNSYWGSTLMTTLLHFRGDVTIEEIVNKTSIHEEDVFDTLSRLNLLCYRKTLEDGRQNVCITEDMLQETLVKFNIKLGRQLDPKLIRWK
ncbi:histone acetyltransferase KAT8-like [Mucor ambiguus]|uniref:histone acetyltransferase n=1 Tax=Mucor ambiguus TaxID=91626 RepID=A0A0C9MDI3_9FUNG|nr:histone acetyltransferase KAT8-like [Mucor ambiguus]